MKEETLLEEGEEEPNEVFKDKENSTLLRTKFPPKEEEDIMDQCSCVLHCEPYLQRMKKP